MSRQTTMSLQLQRWWRLQQTQVLKKLSQPQSMWYLHNRLFVNLQLFSAIMWYCTKWRLIFSFQVICSQEKPKGNPGQSQLADKPRASGIRNTRSSRAASNEANPAPVTAYVATQQLKDMAAKKWLAAKKTGGEIFVTPLTVVNVFVSAVKVFIECVNYMLSF